MKFLQRIVLRLAAGAVVLPATRMAGAHTVLLATCSALLSVFSSLPAHADSKAAAELTLKTCSDAMEDFAKIEAAARDDGWAASRQPIPEGMTKFMRNRSMWTVSQNGGTYFVQIWESLSGEELKQPPRRVCAINFRNMTVNRDEFFNQVSAAMDLTFASETRTPQMRTERYEINRYRPNRVHITINATLDGVVRSVLVQEMHRFAVPGLQPAAPPGVER
jgi:hypothetical protein